MSRNDEHKYKLYAFLRLPKWLYKDPNFNAVDRRDSWSVYNDETGPVGGEGGGEVVELQRLDLGAGSRRSFAVPDLTISSGKCRDAPRCMQCAYRNNRLVGRSARAHCARAAPLPPGCMPYSHAWHAYHDAPKGDGVLFLFFIFITQ